MGRAADGAWACARGAVLELPSLSLSCSSRPSLARRAVLSHAAQPTNRVAEYGCSIGIAECGCIVRMTFEQPSTSPLDLRAPCSCGMMFIPNDDALEKKCREVFEAVAKAENFKASPVGRAGEAGLAASIRTVQRSGAAAAVAVRRHLCGSCLHALDCSALLTVRPGLLRRLSPGAMCPWT